MTEEKALAPYDEIKELGRNPRTIETFTELLGEDEARPYIASVLMTVQSDDRLKQCTPKSIWVAAAKAAGFRLSVDPALGWAYLVGRKKKGILEACFEPGYKGYVQLAMRTKQYKIINVAEIYEGQEVIEDQLTGLIRLNGKKQSDEVVGLCAYFRLLSGYEKYLYMTVEQIHAHAKKYNPGGYKNPKGAWKTSTRAMEKKTPLRLLLSKYGILSLRNAIGEENGHADEEPAFDVDAQFTEVEGDGDNSEPETVKPSGARPWAASIINALVDANMVQNSIHAHNSLNLSNLDTTVVTVAEAKAWVKAHQAWKDKGKTTIEAAELANNGEVPA